MCVIENTLGKDLLLQGCHRSGKVKEIQCQRKVKEFCNLSGKFSRLTCNNSAMPQIRKKGKPE